MGLIPDDVISQVIDRTDIVETIGSYIPLKRVGRNFKGLCPFHHEKTPSFIVNPDRQIYRCFGCGEGGNVLGFVMKQERLEFPEAVRMLAEKAGIVVPETRSDPAKDSLRQKVFEANEAAVEYYHSNLINSNDPEVKVARDYLRARSINAECAKRFKIGLAFETWDGLLKYLQKKGFDPRVIESSGLVVARDDGKGFYDRFRGRVIFSIFDHRSRPVAFGARALKKDERAKYINSPETPVYTKGQHLYGFNLSKDAVGREDAAVVVEGYLDFIRPFSAGVENVAASLGTALTVDQIRLIRRYTHNVIMLYDMDSAGQMATLRSLDVLLEEDMNVRIATLAADEDPDSFILKYGIEEFRKCLADAKSLFDFKMALLAKMHRVDVIEGRAKICQEMIPTIDRIKSEVVKNGYFKELAQQLKVPEAVLIKERENVLQKKHFRNPSDGLAEVPFKEVKVPKDEGTILRMMLANSKWVALVRESVSAEDFHHPSVRAVAAKLMELSGQGVEAKAAELIEHIEDEAARRLITATADDPSVAGSDEGRIFQDCLSRLKKSKLRARREGLREAIRLAEKSGDRATVLSLQKEFNQLIKE